MREKREREREGSGEQCYWVRGEEESSFDHSFKERKDTHKKKEHSSSAMQRVGQGRRHCLLCIWVSGALVAIPAEDAFRSMVTITITGSGSLFSGIKTSVR